MPIKPRAADLHNTCCCWLVLTDVGPKNVLSYAPNQKFKKKTLPYSAGVGDLAFWL